MSEGGAEEAAAPIDKKQLLQWLSDLTGRTVSRFDDLKDGSVLLVGCEKVFPVTFNPQRRKRGTTTWETIRLGLADSGVPVELCDARAISVRSAGGTLLPRS